MLANLSLWMFREESEASEVVQVHTRRHGRKAEGTDMSTHLGCQKFTHIHSTWMYMVHLREFKKIYYRYTILMLKYIFIFTYIYTYIYLYLNSVTCVTPLNLSCKQLGWLLSAL